MVGPGPLAMILCEPGQARKGAAAAVELCAGVSLMESPPVFSPLLFFLLIILDSHELVSALPESSLLLLDLCPC